MLGSRKIYVIDTNVLIDYPDIIPYDSTTRPEQPTIEVETAHLIVPSAVVRENSNFKKEYTERGNTSRVFLRQERDVVESNPVPSMEEVYNLKSEATIKIGDMDTPVSLLPVHKNFKECLPFAPSDDDMDGQIILAVLTVMALEKGLPIDGTASISKMMNLCGRSSKVVLLTNDNGLAIRAWERGISTSRYGYKYPAPYTGRRDLAVPRDVFLEFYNEGVLDRDVWEEYMPREEPLVANEFIAMHLKSVYDYPRSFVASGNPYFRHIGRYDALRDQIVKLQYVSEAPFHIPNDGQAMYAEGLLHPDFSTVICTGPAGSGKTYLPTIYGINACQKGKFIDVALVPCADHGKLGALPGDLNKKMALDVGPTRCAIRNYLLNTDPHFKREWEKIQRNGMLLSYERYKNGELGPSLSNELDEYISFVWQAIFRNVPVEKAQGLDFAYELIHYDEFQDQSPARADMLIKRLGKGSKMVITGDIEQLHAPYLDRDNNGIVYALRELFNDPMVVRVSLFEKEVERHPLVKMITERQANRRKKREQKA